MLIAVTRVLQVFDSMVQIDTNNDARVGGYRQIGGRVVRSHARGGTANMGVTPMKPLKGEGPRSKKKVEYI